MVMKRNHQCSLGLGSESMLPKKPNVSWCSRMFREFHKLFLISEHHPLVCDYFRSYPALLDERRRYFAERSNVIHPLSVFSLIWKSLMIFINFTHIIVATLRFCVITDPFTMLYIESCDTILFSLQVLCFIDMIICFNTGYLNENAALIELSRIKIARSYILTYWVPDMLSWIPVSFVMLMIRSRSRYDMLVPDIIPLARLVRIVTMVEDLKTLLRLLGASHLWYRGMRHVLLVVLAIHCLTCVIYVPSCFKHYVYGHVPLGYTGFLDKQNVTRVFYDVTSTQRYLKAMYVSISAFFSSGFSMFYTYYKSEIVVNSCIMLFGTMFKLYSVVYWLKTYMTVYNSTLRYLELMDQVEKFMSHYQLPVPLMRRLRAYYKYTFQEQYFKESISLGYLSAHLQSEIRLHTHQKLLEKTPILHDLPPSFLGRVLAYLEHEVYLPDDMVFHVGDFSKDAFFIYKGTLALYTVNGVEVMHLQDGDIVGTLALLTKEVRRITTLVAIEITQVYRLSFKNLRELNSVNMELRKRINENTLKRYKQILRLDESALRDVSGW